jgi:DNA repair exonuclease SbcCD ATPase subunit
MSSQTIYYILAIGAFLAVIANTIASVKLGFGRKKSDNEREAVATIALKDARIMEIQAELDKTKTQVIQDGKDIAVLQSENATLKAFNANKNPELENILKQLVHTLGEQTVAINQLLARGGTTNVTVGTQ